MQPTARQAPARKPRIPPSGVCASFEESQRINRPYPLDFPYGLLLRALSREVRQRIHSLSGAVLMQRINSA
jgi:hypothetical protein